MSAALLKRQEGLVKKMTNLPENLQARIQTDPRFQDNQLIDGAVANLRNYWADFVQNHDVLVTEVGFEASDYNRRDFYSSAELDYLSSLAKLERLRPAPPAPAPTAPKVETHPSVPPQRESLPQLPRISLPEFSGAYLEWESFRDQFEGLVLNRSDVPDVQKLLLLQRALKGDAAHLVRNIPATTANFRGTWDTVCARYTNERLLVHAHLSALFDLPQVPRECARDMRTLIDRAREELRSLRQLKRPVDEWDDIIVFMLLRRLDPVSRREWELHLTSQDAANTLVNHDYRPTLPTMNQLEAFIESRIRALEMSAATSAPRSTASKENRPEKSRQHRSHQASVSPNTQACVFCGEQHSNFSCSSFRARTPQDRLAEVKRLKICFNCLGVHQRHACKSTRTCVLCKKTHNTLLHEAMTARDQQSPTSIPVASQGDIPTPGALTVASSTARVSTTRKTKTALLTTALVTILQPGGRRMQARALLDTGSEVSFVSEDIVQSLGLTKWRSPVKVVGVGASHSASATYQATVEFVSRCNPSACHRVSAFVLPRLTAHSAQRAVCPIDLHMLSTIQLADPDYSKDQKVGLILGADIFSSLVRPGVCAVPDTNVVAINTSLGWVLTGTVDGEAQTSVSTYHCRVEDDLDRNLRRFWEIEEVFTAPPELSTEEQKCEEHFVSTYQQDATGRFVVRLPRKSDVPTGVNRNQAVSSLLSLERRLMRNPTIGEKYHAFMNEYESMGHMQRTEPTTSGTGWYLPHHAVIQPSPSGEKLRVVFDASRLNDRGMSLNQHLLPGPALQPDLGTVIMNWRNHRIVVSADIVKMFRQILVHPEDQDLQRIVWRSSSDDAIQDFKLSTVTYGTACAPYLAIRVLHEIARLEQHHFPRGAECLLRDTYVDDILTGADSLQDAITRRDELIQILATDQLRLSKWAANRVELLEDIVTTPSSTANVELAAATKMLGICWNPKKDEFHFQQRLSATTAAPVTKRAVLSIASQLFDPLGWIAPVIITAKILLQDLWIAKCDWDEPLSSALEERWFAFRCGLSNLEDIRIPRRLHEPLSSALEERWFAFRCGLSNLEDIRIPRWTQLTPEDTAAELHGFADASTRAYAAVVYLRTTNADGSFHTIILASKTKAAPIKTVSVPRLELCAAQLLVRLLLYVRHSYRLAKLPMFGWSDSTVALSWIQSHPSRWKTFVANRTSYIQTSLPDLTWRHVRSSDNPADIASRGSSPQALATNRLWWRGPSWLALPKQDWPDSKPDLCPSPGEEAPKFSSAMPAQVEEAEFELLNRYSSLTRTIRVTALCMRFARRCDRKGKISSLSDREKQEQHPTATFLSTLELTDAKMRLIRCAQKTPFADEIERLKSARPVSRSSPLASLHPYLEHGVLRVGGRLENSRLPQRQKHPPILPKTSALSRLFIQFAHESALHAGLSLTYALLQQHVWILRGRTLAKQLLRGCVTCRRRHPQIGRQLMGQLPAARVVPGRPFLRSGVDYAGPIQCRPAPGRGRQSIKAYIALFVCLSTKALHLEVVSDLTSAAFLAAFRRFAARRGVCQELISDNGTTFVGADAELRSLFREASVFYQEVASTLADSGTRWSFIPPASPHFGGLWEAGVKSVKGLLRKTIGDATLTYEELSTVLAQVEACLNSRPLTPLLSDATDLEILTPAHFLVGSSLLSVPEPGVEEEPKHLVTRWRLVQQLTHHFWRKWSTQYLHQLQQRSRWHSEKSNFTVGQLVLVHHPQLPPGKWSLGRVTELHPGADGLVRVVTVKTASSVFRRPISRLSPLPVDISDVSIPHVHPTPGELPTTPSIAPPCHGGQSEPDDDIMGRQDEESI